MGMEGSMQMRGGGGVEAVEIFGWPMWRIRLRQASKGVHKDSGKQMLHCWPPRWEGRRKTGEYFGVSSQLEVGPKGRRGLVNLL